jgi:hypothetical protein
MISPTQLAKLVKAYQARQADQDQQDASVTELDVRGSTDADVSRAA